MRERLLDAGPRRSTSSSRAWRSCRSSPARRLRRMGCAALAAAGLTACGRQGGCRRRLPAGGRGHRARARHCRPAPSTRRGRATPSAVGWPPGWRSGLDRLDAVAPGRRDRRHGGRRVGESAAPRNRAWTRRGCARRPDSGDAVPAADPRGSRPGRRRLRARVPPTRRASARPDGGSYEIDVMRREIAMIPDVVAAAVDDPEGRLDLGREIAAGPRHLAPVADRVRRQCLRRSGRRPGLPTAHGRHAARRPRARPGTLPRPATFPSGSAVLGVSFSGQVGRTTEALAQARRFGHPTYALTNAPDCPAGPARRRGRPARGDDARLLPGHVDLRRDARQPAPAGRSPERARLAVTTSLTRGSGRAPRAGGAHPRAVRGAGLALPRSDFGPRLDDVPGRRTG